MNKHKLENGEVNLEKELQKLSKHWIGDIMCDQWIEQVEELFTNALNQQKKELLGEIEKIIPSKMSKGEGWEK